MKNLVLIGVFSGVLAGAVTAQAKEYNQRPHIAPSQQVKVQRLLAKSYRTNDNAPQGVSNVGCGKLEIGRVVTQPGQRLQQFDRDIIITGDVINVARGCKR